MPGAFHRPLLHARPVASSPLPRPTPQPIGVWNSDPHSQSRPGSAPTSESLPIRLSRPRGTGTLGCAFTSTRPFAAVRVRGVSGAQGGHLVAVTAVVSGAEPCGGRLGGREGGRPSWGALAGPRAWRAGRKSQGWISFSIRTRLPELRRERGPGPLTPGPWRTTGLVAEGQRWNFRVCLLRRRNGPEVTGLLGWGPLDPGPRLLLLRFIFAIWAFCKRCGKLTPTPVHP